MSKKILFLNYEFPPLGWWAANANYYMFKEFAKQKDLQITLITTWLDISRQEKFSDNITIHYIDIGKNPDNIHYQSNQDLLKYSFKAYSLAKKLLSTQKFDMIHAFFGIPCWYLAMKLNKKYNIPYIVSLRGSDVPFYNPRFKYLDKFIFKRLSRKIWEKASFVIANSKWLKNLSLETSSEQKIWVIYNWIDLNEFNIKVKRSEKVFNILYTWRLIQRKWVDVLLAWFKEFSASKQDVVLNIVWWWNMEDELKQYVIDNWLEKKVIFHGKKPHKDMAKIYLQNHIYVLPSKNEWMSNTLLEALAAKLPIIITDTWWTKELFNNNWWIIKKDDFNDITTKLELAYKTWKNGKLSILWKNSYNKVKDMTWTQVAKQYLNVYSKVDNA